MRHLALDAAIHGIDFCINSPWTGMKKADFIDWSRAKMS
jgi:hypothetical protein